MKTARPPAWSVVIASICATFTVWSYATGHLNGQWIWLGCLFLTIELVGAVMKEPGHTLSERCWAWLGIRPRRAVRLSLRIPTPIIFCVELGFHIGTGGAYALTSGAAVAISALPFVAVVGYSVIWEHGA